MNTNDFIPYKYFGLKEAFEEIFEKQGKLFWKYIASETSYEINSPKDLDFDINIYQDQQLFKDMLQIRFTEELTEATEDLKHYDHFEEEIIDAFNFLVSTYILYGWGIKDLKKWNSNKKILYTNLRYISSYSEIKSKEFLIKLENELKIKMYEIIKAVGETCNLLKNRPWRGTQYLVDLYKFEPRFRKIWIEFNDLCNELLISPKRLFELWSLKFQCNLYRIDTNY